MRGWIRLAEEFYRLSERRDRVLLENLLKRYQVPNRQKVPGTAVLVAGGFHTPGLTELLRERDIGYAVIAPRLTRFDSPSLYRQVIQGNLVNYLLYQTTSETERVELGGRFRRFGRVVREVARGQSLRVSAAVAAERDEAIQKLRLLRPHRERRLPPKDAADPLRILAGAKTKAAERVRSETRYQVPKGRKVPGTALEKGWVIANHILVSFHAAFISSILSLPSTVTSQWSVLQFMFLSPETLISILFWYLTFHIAVWWHERGHYWQAVRTRTLREDLFREAESRLKQGGLARLAWEIKMFFLSPLGEFPGIKRVGLGFYPEAPFNLSTAAAGPRASGQMAVSTLPLAGGMIAAGLLFGAAPWVYFGRLALGIGAVALLDRFLADPGKYREFRRQEEKAKEARTFVRQAASTRWLDRAARVKARMRITRLQEETRRDGKVLQAPWGFRNSAMGGRHTEKEYPESNISLQEGMFVPLSAETLEEAQEMTVALQNRLKQIIDSTEGSRVMGTGLEGGLAAYVTPEAGDPVPELRLWRMMKQAIEDLGYVPGQDVLIAIDPAASELESAFREEFNQPDAVGQYLFWRDKKQVMTREELLGLYRRALEEDIPIISIEDGFSENDWEGWKLLKSEFGDKLFVVGDDLVTTKDEVIERAADLGAIDVVLVKANQIGTLTETLVAMLVALGKGLELIISHRSKSPNDDMEAQIALASQALGAKFGGGANTERLVKYHSMAKLIREALRGRVLQPAGAPVPNEELVNEAELKNFIDQLVITRITAYEEPTNAGIPTVGVTVSVGIPSTPYDALLSFTGATPLGTSAGMGEAIHLVDSVVEASTLTRDYPDLFTANGDGTFRFKSGVTQKEVLAKRDQDLLEIWQQAERYGGKGVRNAVRYVEDILAPAFLGRKSSELGNLLQIDRTLLQLELRSAQEQGKPIMDPIAVAQRKGNLGMNAILSLSLALARFKAAADGKELWELLQEEMKIAMALIIAEYGGDNDWQPMARELLLPQLAAGLERVAEAAKARGEPFYKIVRRHVPIYDFGAKFPAARAELRSDEGSVVAEEMGFFTPEEILRGMEEALGEKATLLSWYRRYLQSQEMAYFIPPYFVIASDRAQGILQEKERPFSAATWLALRKHLERIGRVENEGFGNPERPLFISVRASATRITPGQYLTLLNVGVNDQTLPALARRLGSEKLAVKVYAKLIEDFLVDLYGKPRKEIQKEVRTLMRRRGKSAKVWRNDFIRFLGGVRRYEKPEEIRWLHRSFTRMRDALEISKDHARLEAYKALYRAYQRMWFPQDPYEQLRLVIEGIQRKSRYTRVSGEEFRGGIVIQRMVFGVGPDSFAGEVLSRDPATGEVKMVGNIEANVQGDMTTGRTRVDHESFQAHPAIADYLEKLLRAGETFFRDAVQIEVTIEKGVPHLLQIQRAKRTNEAQAALIMDLLENKIVTPQEAFEMGEQVNLADLREKVRLGSKEGLVKIATGIPVAPGVGTGRVVVSQAGVHEAITNNIPYILVKQEVRAHDEEAIRHSQGVVSLDQIGNHAEKLALMAKVPGVLGIRLSQVNYDEGIAILRDEKGRRHRLSERNPEDYLTLENGTVYLGQDEIIREPRDEMPRRVAEFVAFMMKAKGKTPSFMVETPEGIVVRWDEEMLRRQIDARNAEGDPLYTIVNVIEEGSTIEFEPVRHPVTGEMIQYGKVSPSAPSDEERVEDELEGEKFEEEPSIPADREIPPEVIDVAVREVLREKNSLEGFTYELWWNYDHLDLYAYRYQQGVPLEKVADEYATKIFYVPKNVRYRNEEEAQIQYFLKVLDQAEDRLAEAVFHRVERHKPSRFFFRSAVVGHLDPARAKRFFKKTLAQAIQKGHGEMDEMMAQITAVLIRERPDFVQEAFQEMTAEERGWLLVELHRFYEGRRYYEKTEDEEIAAPLAIRGFLRASVLDRNLDFEVVGESYEKGKIWSLRRRKTVTTEQMRSDVLDWMQLEAEPVARRSELRMRKGVRPRIILFDVDGVLVWNPTREEQWGRVVRELGERFGVSIADPAQFRREVFYVGDDREGYSKLVRGDLDEGGYIREVNQRLAKLYNIRHEFTLDEWMSFIFSDRALDRNGAREEVAATLERLRRENPEVILGILSDRAPGDVEFFDELLARFYPGLLDPGFRFVSLELRAAKADGSIFPKVLSLLRETEGFEDIEAEELLLVDDKPENVERAQSFGLQVAQFVFGRGSLQETLAPYFRRSELRAEVRGKAIRISSPSEIPQAIASVLKQVEDSSLGPPDRDIVISALQEAAELAEQSKIDLSLVLEKVRSVGKNFPSSGAPSLTGAKEALGSLARALKRFARPPGSRGRDLGSGRRGPRRGRPRSEVRAPINPFLIDIQEQVRQAGRILGMGPEAIAEILEPEHTFAQWLTTSKELTSGRRERFFVARVQHRRPIGEDGRPERAQGGIRIILPEMLGRGPDDLNSPFYQAVKQLKPYLTGELQTDEILLNHFLENWVTAEARALATGMSFKNKVAGLPLGGGKGVILLARWDHNDNGQWVLVPINDGKFEEKDLAILMRDVARAFAQEYIIHETIDGGAPDVNPFKHFLSTGYLMGWLVDETLEYLMEEPRHPFWGKEPELLQHLRRASDSLTGTPYLDTAIAYAQRTGRPVPLISRYTGKKVGQGGSLYRDKSTGEGTHMAAEALVEKLYPVKAQGPRPMDGLKEAIQGFGNAAIFAALRAVRLGAQVIALSDSGGAIVKREGFSEEDLQKLIRLKEGTTERKSLIDAVGNHDGNYQIDGAQILIGLEEKEDGTLRMLTISGEELVALSDQERREFLEARKELLEEGKRQLLELDVDILIPAALENQIHEGNADRIRARIVSEAANGASTKGAIQQLFNRPEEKRTYVIPFILASAGGVAVSSKEIEQNFTNRYLSEEELRQWLQAQMRQAVDDVWEEHSARQVDLGTAAYLVGMKRLTRRPDGTIAAPRSEVREAMIFISYAAAGGVFPRGMRLPVIASPAKVLWRGEAISGPWDRVRNLRSRIASASSGMPPRNDRALLARLPARQAMTDANRDTPRTVVLAGFGSDIPGVDLEAMELAAGSRVAVLDSGRADSGGYDRYAKVKIPGVRLHRERLEGNLPTIRELKKIFAEDPGNVPVLLFPPGFGELLKFYQRTASGPGFVASMPQLETAQSGLSYLLGHTVPATLLQQVPDGMLQAEIVTDALSPVSLAANAAAERSFAEFYLTELAARELVTSAA